MGRSPSESSAAAEELPGKRSEESAARHRRCVGACSNRPRPSGRGHNRKPGGSRRQLRSSLRDVALWAPWRAEKPVDKPLVRLDVDLGPEISLPPIVAGPASFLHSVVISPDGTRLVYVASTAGGPPRLFTRRLDQPKATELPGTTGAIGPFFSPDGQWVGFFAGGKFNKISVEGGAVVPLAAANGSAGASWGQDGSIILGGSFNAGLTRIPSGGGAPTKVTDLADGEIAQANPQVLPGGKAVLFAAYPTLVPEKAQIDVITLADGHRKTLVPGRHFRALSGYVAGGRTSGLCKQGNSVCDPVRSGASGDAWDGGPDSGRRGLRPGGWRRSVRCLRKRHAGLPPEQRRRLARDGNASMA